MSDPIRQGGRSGHGDLAGWRPTALDAGRRTPGARHGGNAPALEHWFGDLPPDQETIVGAEATESPAAAPTVGERVVRILARLGRRGDA